MYSVHIHIHSLTVRLRTILEQSHGTTVPELVGQFGKNWSYNARCFSLEPTEGHIVGTVIQRTKVTGRKSAPNISYDIAWEYTGLGESSVPHGFLLEGCQVGSRLATVRKQGNSASNDNIPNDAQRVRGRQKGRKKLAIMEKFRDALNNASDDDSNAEAPLSDSGASFDSNEDEEEHETNLTEWLIFGNAELPVITSNDAAESVATPDLTVDSAPAVSLISCDGLHWENGTEICNPPSDKMPMQPAKIKDGYKHLFSTPIDAMFALIP
jgi:hypothetical protein